jgi:hypothetical protein
MSRFKSGGKTVVTQVKMIAVSPHSRGICFKQTVSAKIPLGESLTELNRATCKSQPIVIEQDIKHIFALSVPFPVQLTFTQEPVLEELVSHNLYVTVQVLPNSYIDIRVEDIEHKEHKTLQIQAESNGKMESFLAFATSPGVFVYRYHLLSDGVAGTSYTISYLTAPKADGQRDKIERNVRVVEELEAITGQLSVASRTGLGTTLAIRVDDPGQPTASVSVLNTRTFKYSLLSIPEQVTGSGIFEGSIEVRDGELDSSSSFIYGQEGDILHITYVDAHNEDNKTAIVRKEVALGAAINTSLHSTSLLVDGVFILNGSFKGQGITIRGLTDEFVPCELLYS